MRPANELIYFLSPANDWSKLPRNPPDSDQQTWSQPDWSQIEGEHTERMSQVSLNEFSGRLLLGFSISANGCFHHQTHEGWIGLWQPAVLTAGHPHHSSFHQDLQLEQRKHVFPHHHRKPGAREQTAVWNFSGEQICHFISCKGNRL